jgi:hypothetical protein
LCVLGGDDFAGRVLPVMATQPADVPFLGMPIAVAVDVHAHFDAVDVQRLVCRFPISLGGLLVKIRIGIAIPGAVLGLDLVILR